MSSGSKPVLPSSPLWLQKINYDIVFSIASWLDPLSLLQISCTCTLLQSMISQDQLIWSRALHDISVEHCIAPHSFDGLSISDLKRVSVRPKLLYAAFRDPKRPLRANMRKYTLGYQTSLAGGLPNNMDAEPDVQYLHPYLLPGGRWILSGVIDEKSTTHLCCWDRTMNPSDGSPLQPVASFKWEGLMPWNETNWLHAQLHGSQVSLVCSLWGRVNDAQGVTHDILTLSWSDDTHLPVIERVARLEHDARYIDGNLFPDYHFQGDYLILENTRSIVLWNWRENLIGVIDDEQHEWANGTGFLLVTMPPYLFVFPGNMKDILVLGIPNLHPVDSPESHKPVRPSSTKLYPFIEDAGQLVYAKIRLLDEWKQPSLQSGTYMLVLKETRGERHFYIGSLQTATNSPVTPSYAPQMIDSSTLDGVREFDRAVVAGDAGIGDGVLALGGYTIDSDRNTNLTSRFYPLGGDDDFSEVIERRFSLGFSRWTPPGPVCLVSGTSILSDRCAGTRLDTQVVSIITFECEPPEENPPIPFI
ncbi:hypothetical protein DL93DRAFT_1100174 [Clavulina sp. PMI_390]|nr:hypothetical protein DL93DRAFT_1100174 [Clavulina sp. PMI_390]